MVKTVVLARELGAQHLGKRVRVISDGGSASISGVLSRVQHVAQTIRRPAWGGGEPDLGPGAHRLSVTVGPFTWDDLDVDLVAVEVFE